VYLWLVACLYLSKEELVFLWGAPLLIVFTWRQFAESRRRVEIDPAVGEISIYELTFFAGKITHTYPLSQFGAVRSVVTSALIGRYFENRVELLIKGKQQGLLLETYPPAVIGDLHYGENPKAEELCHLVAEIAGVTNLGFQKNAPRCDAIVRASTTRVSR
jgi:hypothetical protein